MRKIFLVITVFCFLTSSCIKAPIDVVDNASPSDPNISYYDNYEIELSTYKIDSFLTSGTSTFVVGYHRDSLFGTITSGSYAQIDLAATNPVKNNNVSFDSLVLMLAPNGEYYGDTLIPFRIQVHRLLQKVENDESDDNNFYNPRKFSYDPAILGSYTSVIRPKRGSGISIRLSDVLGQELMLKLKNNDNDIEDNTSFINYFKGVYLGTDTLFSKTLYYFRPSTGSGIMRLYYHLNGTFSEEKYLDFPVSSTRQFNNLTYNHIGTNLSVFTPYKKQLKKSSLTGHKAFLHTNMSSYIKISFPSILQLKELYPYVKIMKAELVITPSPGTYRYPYQLPSAIYLYTTDDNNTLNQQLGDITGQSPLTGNLFIDKLYGDKTNYTYDITGFINTLVDEGRFSELALMLVPEATSPSTKLQRLVINDQTLTKGIQLKLYLLGL
jgi:Domain of unknown function (DUF4270)